MNVMRIAERTVSYSEWDGLVEEYRAHAYRYRWLLEWTGAWTGGQKQATRQYGFTHAIQDAARAYWTLDLTPVL